MTRRLRLRVTAAVAVVVALLAGAPPSVRAQELLTGATAPPPVTAAGAVVYEPAADALLYDKAARTPRPMASTTKIMTVLLALEAGTLDDTVTVSPHAAAVGRIPGASTLDLEAGQTLPMRSLLAGLVLRSGNDGATAVAEHVAGSEEAFVARMNARAAELGLEQTAFVDPTGLSDDPAHHASPLDLAKLAEEAMRHEAFTEWAGAASLQVPGLPPMTNRNLLLQRYAGATGVKTGYTSLAGNTLVASAERDGRTLYAVVLGSQDSFADTTALLDYGFGAFQRPSPLAAGQEATAYRWSDQAVGAVAAEELAATVPAGAEVRWRVRLEPAVARPLPEGARLGEAELVVDGEVVDRVELRSAAAVPAPAPPASPAAAVGAALQSSLRDLLRAQPLDRAVAG
ncbi:MAG TPA: D-alanyl-D-alanine carboxypeptidase family protein [Egibacteraceae bacterium]